MPTLAIFVLRRAQRSVYLIEGLRRALHDLGRPDLVAVLDLVAEDAAEAQKASQDFIAAQRRSKRARIMADLGRITVLGNIGIKRVVTKLTQEIDSPSGEHLAFRQPIQAP